MVLTLECLLFVDRDAIDAPILAEVLVAAQGVLLGDVWREADDVERVSLKDAD